MTKIEQSLREQVVMDEYRLNRKFLRDSCPAYLVNAELVLYAKWVNYVQWN